MALLKRIAGVFPLKTWLILAVVVALGLALVGWRCSHAAAERRKAEVAVLQETIKIRERDARARDNAADERLTDAIKNQAAREELSNAVEDLPDARPSDRRLRLACARLRRQGTPDAALPASCRPEG